MWFVYRISNQLQWIQTLSVPTVDAKFWLSNLASGEWKQKRAAKSTGAMKKKTNCNFELDEARVLWRINSRKFNRFANLYILCQTTNWLHHTVLLESKFYDFQFAIYLWLLLTFWCQQIRSLVKHVSICYRILRNAPIYPSEKKIKEQKEALNKNELTVVNEKKYVLDVLSK